MDRKLKTNPIATLRERLVPKGTGDIVKLQLSNHGYVDGVLVRGAIDAAETCIANLEVFGQELNNLEKLGLMLLAESAAV